MIAQLYFWATGLLALAGLVLAVAFLATHRPNRWRSIAAIDASGWVLVCVLALGRAVVLTALRYQHPVAPSSLASAVFGLVTLLAIDWLLFIRLRAFVRFRRRDRRG